MKRNVGIGYLQRIMFTAALSVSLSGQTTNAQSGVNVVEFLDAVGRICGGTVSQEVESDNNNMTLKDTEITVDPGTGSLSVERNGVIIAELDGQQTDRYYDCVRNLTESLGGQFISPPGDQDERNPSRQDDVDLQQTDQEPTQSEMRTAHESLVNPAALRLFPIDHFQKQGCERMGNERYRCSYSIRSGGFGPVKNVTNIFMKIGSSWTMAGG